MLGMVPPWSELILYMFFLFMLASNNFLHNYVLRKQEHEHSSAIKAPITSLKVQGSNFNPIPYCPVGGGGGGLQIWNGF